jgi:hypothetical protein
MTDPTTVPEVTTVLTWAKDLTITALLLVVVVAGHYRRWVYGWILQRADEDKAKAEARADAWQNAFSKNSEHLDQILVMQREIKDLLTEVLHRRGK